MTDEIWTRDEIDSPCVKVCLLDPQAGICIGCHRTGEEIARWSRLSARKRQRIMAELPARGAKLTQKRRGGREGRRGRKRRSISQ